MCFLQSKIIAIVKAFTDNTPARWGIMTIFLPVGIAFVLSGIAMWDKSLLVAIIFLAFGGILTVLGLVLGIYWIINYNQPNYNQPDDILKEIKAGIEILLERTEPPKQVDIGAINRTIKEHLDGFHERESKQ